MTFLERIQAAVSFKKPDRIPRWDHFSVYRTFPERWRKWKGFGERVKPEDYGIDVFVASCDEGPFFQAGVVETDRSRYALYRDARG